MNRYHALTVDIPVAPFVPAGIPLVIGTICCTIDVLTAICPGPVSTTVCVDLLSVKPLPGWNTLPRALDVALAMAGILLSAFGVSTILPFASIVGPEPNIPESLPKSALFISPPAIEGTDPTTGAGAPPIGALRLLNIPERFILCTGPKIEASSACNFCCSLVGGYCKLL